MSLQYMQSQYTQPQYVQPQYPQPPIYPQYRQPSMYPEYPPTYEAPEQSNLSQKLFALAMFGFLCYIAYITYQNKNTTNEVKFKLGNVKSTNWNDTSDNNDNIFLDRHNIICDKKSGINKFKYVLGDPNNNDQKNKLKYVYTCSQGEELEDSLIAKSTESTLDDNQNFKIFDKHDVKCSTDEILNQFKVNRPSNTTINYSYNCIKSKKPLKCRNLKTSLVTKNDADNTRNLKNLEPICAEDEVLQRFQLFQNDNKTSIGYDYTCCKY